MTAKPLCLPQFSLVVALIAVVAWPLAGCRERVPQDTTASPGPSKELTILTPHSAKIRDVFGEGFWHWYVARHGTPVRVNWIYRGTPQCIDYVRSVPKLRAKGARIDVPDIMFGGGIGDHARLADDELSRPIDLGDVFAEVPAEINGIPTRHPEGRWHATGLSTFGILYNDWACKHRGIAPPTTWADLADARFVDGWTAVADPRASGSHRECLMLILQHQGWDQGWQTIMRILGNTRALNHRSGAALSQVQSDISVATFAVNFDGMSRVAESRGRLKYIDPPQATAVTPDVISVLAMAPEPEVAKAFVEYVLSEEGQALLAVDRAHTKPYGETLYHHAILPSIYEKYAGKLAVSGNPFSTEFGLKIDTDESAWQGRLLKALIGAACDNANHIALQDAWSAVIDAGQDASLVSMLTAPPMTEEEARRAADELDAADAAARAEMIANWAKLFADRYAEVQNAAKAAPATQAAG